jgi:O-antigen ligase
MPKSQDSTPRLSLSVDTATAPATHAGSIFLFILIGIVALTPLPFGSARHWAWEVLTALIGLLMTVVGIHHLWHPKDRKPDLRSLRVSIALFCVVVVWATLQCLPFTPAAWHHPLWSQAQEYFGEQVVSSVSVDRVASTSRLFRLVTYAAIFWLAYSFCLDPQRARTLVKSVAMIVALYAAWGLIVYGTGNTTILWFQKWAYNYDLTGTFVNRNSFATFAGLGLLATVALLFETMRKRIDFGESRRGIFKSTVEFLVVHARWLTLAALGIATALLLTHSRAGAISTILGLVAFLVAVSAAPSLRAQWQTKFGISLIVALGILVLIGDKVTVGRLSETSFEDDGRVRIFELTLQAIRDWPFVGTGLGSLRDVFPLYRTEDLPLAVDRAHNDYLETVVELGLPAAVALFLSIASLLWICLMGVRRRRRDALFPCIGIGATTLVAVHSLVDFSLQTPAVTSIYLLLMGAAVAQSFNSSHSTQ